MSHDGVPLRFEITFEDILVFATGSASEPPIGFDYQYLVKHLCIYLSADEIPYKNFKHCISYGILNTAGCSKCYT